MIWPFIVGAVLVLGFVIWFQCIRKREAEMVVSGHHWERSVAIEVFNDYPESRWRNEVPPNATGNIICRQEQRSTRQVPDGEDCKMERHDKKDGTFEQVKKCTAKTKSEPVMDDKCSYTVRRWQKTDEAKSLGQRDDAHHGAESTGG